MLVNAVRVLELSRPVAKTIPIIGPMVEGSIEAALQVVSAVEGMKALRDDWIRLAESGASITSAVVLALQGRRHSSDDLDMRAHIVTLLRTLHHCEARARRAARVGALERFWKGKQMKDDLDGCRRELDEAAVLFGIKSHILVASTLHDLSKVIEDRLHAVENRLVNLHCDVSTISTNLPAFAEHDGMFRYFLWSDFELVKTYTPVNSSVEEHEVVDCRTSKIRVVRRYHPSDERILSVLSVMKSSGHANVEQLVGYSRKGAPGNPFYVVDAGEVFLDDLVDTLDIRRKVRLICNIASQFYEWEKAIRFIHKITGMRSAEADCIRGILQCYDTNDAGHLLRARVASGGRLIFPLPLPVLNSVAPVEVRHGDALNYDSRWEYVQATGTDTDRWLELLDKISNFKHEYAVPVERLDRYSLHIYVIDGANIEALLAFSNFYPPKRHPLDTERISAFSRHGVVGQWNLLWPHHRERQTCYRIPQWSAQSIFGYRHIYTPRTNIWRALGVSIRNIATTARVPPTSIGAVTSSCDCTWVCDLDSPFSPVSSTNPIRSREQDLDTICSRPDLYFFPYPREEYGPHHISPGYLSLDAEGTEQSTFISYEWNDGEWRIEVDLRGRRMLLLRDIKVSLARFNEEELAMMSEDRFW